jgi:hypothetical protein
MADCASVEGSCNGRSAVVSVYFLSDYLCLADYGLYQYNLLSFCDADPLFELGWKIDVEIHPIMYTLKDWLERNFSLFYKNVEQDGIVLC